jgi:hypothetical protein
MGGAYLVGEKGPELFVPSQAGYVYSNSQTGAILGSRQEGGPVEAIKQFLGTPQGRAALALPLAPISPLVLPAAAAAPQIAEAATSPLGRTVIGGTIAAAGLAAIPFTGGASIGVTTLATSAGLGTIGALGGGALGLEAPRILGGIGDAIQEHAVRPAADALSTVFTDASKAIRENADRLPGPLGDAARAAADFADATANKAKEIATPPPPPPGPSDINAGGGVGDKPYGPLQGITPTQVATTAGTLAQQQAQYRVNQANARLQQAQAESQLRGLDVNRLSVAMDGRRVSAAEALNRYTADRLSLEGQLAPLQLRQQQIQDQITIRTQENLELRKGLIQAQQAELPAGAAVERLGFQQQQARLRLQVGMQQVMRGEQPQYNIQEQFRTIFRTSDFFQAPQKLDELEKQQDVYERGLAVQSDQMTKAMDAIPFEEQQQANQRSILMYQEQINAAQASSDAVTRVLQMADLIAAPERIQAQKDLNDATLASAQAAQKIADAIIAEMPPGRGLPEGPGVGAIGPVEGGEVGQPGAQNLPGPGTPGARPTPAPTQAAISPARLEAASRAADAAGQAAIAAQKSVEDASAAAAAAYQQALVATPAAAAAQAPAPAAAPAETPAPAAAPAQPPSIPEVAGGVAEALTPEQEQQILDQRVAIREMLMQSGFNISTRDVQRALLQTGPGGVGPRQAGGEVAQASSYLVGEAGPELFVPHGNGWGMSEDTVAISNLLRNAGGGPIGGDTHVHLNMGDVTVRSHDDILAMQQAVIDAATRGTLQALRRGNSYMPRRVSPTVAGGRGF